MDGDPALTPRPAGPGEVPAALVTIGGVAFRAPAAPDAARVRSGAFVAYFLVFGAWSVVASWHARLWLGALAAFVYVEYAAVLLRGRRLTGRAVLDEATCARLAGPLRELCGRAGCALPRVTVLSHGLRSAYVVAGRDATQLVVTAELLERLDDAELRAILAHEVAHLAAGDPARGRRLGQRVTFLAALSGGALVIVLHARDVPVPIVVAALLAVLLVVRRLFAPSQRAVEARADATAVRLTGDAAPLATALESVHALAEDTRRRFLAGPWRWALLPLAWRPRTHPALAERLAALRGPDAHDAAPR